MFENIVFLLIGAFCIYGGILSRKGNLSLIRPLRRRRIAEADRLPFGKIVGLSTIIIGVGAIFNGVFSLLSQLLSAQILATMGFILFVIGIAIGAILSFYAMIKYNKGIF